jgi:hypothetical protein
VHHSNTNSRSNSGTVFLSKVLRLNTLSWPGHVLHFHPPPGELQKCEQP